MLLKSQLQKLIIANASIVTTVKKKKEYIGNSKH